MQPLAHVRSSYIERVIVNFVFPHDKAKFEISHRTSTKRSEVMVHMILGLVMISHELEFDASLMPLACILRELLRILFSTMIEQNLKYLAVLMSKLLTS